MTRLTLCFLLLAGLPVAALRAAPPDLREQAAWGDKEKKEFLNYLNSGQGAPVAGQVKRVAAENGIRVQRKARYASLGLASDTLVLEKPGGGTRTETTTVGAKLLVGGHLFSWVRYYAGLKYNRVGQERLDGTRAHLGHVEAPAGLELALIPLGTPHTRYALLRAGVSSHFFSGPDARSEFAAPLRGWHPAWNLGLGYEWQFDNSPWRAHALAEGYRAFPRSGKPGFRGLGLTAGFVYTF
ncbi:MAG: hypothetical protein AB7V08_14615 [Elusimicrobiales bacterium]